MVKLVNHIDHVTWICKSENLETSIKKMEHIFDVQFEASQRLDELGFTVCLCWEAGLEVVAPHTETMTEFNKSMHSHLDTIGEGLYAVVFGVDNLEKSRQDLIAKGYRPSEIWGDFPDSPWQKKIAMKELDATILLNSRIVFGEINYSEGIIQVK